MARKGKRDWRVGVLKELGLPVTRDNLRFLDSWQRWEGGHTNNDASFNWLNTTRGPGRSINSVGVKAFDDYLTGIEQTAATIRNGRYGDIISGLASGNPYAHDVRRGLSTWVSGDPTSEHGAQYAARVLGTRAPQSGGVAPPGQPVRAQASSSPAPAAAPGPDIGAMRTGVLTALLADRRGGGSRSSSIAALGALNDALSAPPPTPRARQLGPAPRSQPMPAGKKAELRTGRNWRGTHDTDNLWEDSPTARDFMAPAGTTVGAPEDGVVISHGSAQGGRSLMFRGKSGRVYWLGHIDDMVKPGTRVRAGQVIARVSADHAAPHLHIDYEER